MRYIKILLSILLFSILMVLISCSHDEDRISIEPNYESIQSELFDKHCVPCHSGTAASAGLDLQNGRAYEAMFSKTNIYRPQLVVPGNAEGSFLYQRLVGKINPMPPSGPLHKAYIDAVRSWINNGAQK